MHAIDRRQLLAAGIVAGTVAVLPGAPVIRPAPVKHKFKLGIVTYNVAKDWDVPTILNVCKTVGLSAVEFRTTHKHGVEPTLSKDQRKDIKKMCNDAGVQIWGCGTTCEFHSPSAAEVSKQIEICKRFVELAADIGGRGVKVRPNGLPKDVPEEKTIEQIGKSLIPCGKAAAEAGVEIHVEVHGNGTAHPPRVKAMMEHCGHTSVGLTWNSNPTDVKEGSVGEYFRMLWPWIKSCHINDIYKAVDGTYPYRELFLLLRENGYDRVTLIEVGQAMPDVASSITFLRYYKALWQELCRA